MRIVIVSDWFAEKMGYSENLLPRALAKFGHEVHVVTSDLQPLFPNYKEMYEPFLGPRVQPVGTKELNGFTLHRLPHCSQRHSVWIKGLHRKLVELRPDIVQCFVIFSFSTYQVALSKLRLDYKFFLEEHMHKSVFWVPRRWKGQLFYFLYRHTIGKWLGSVSEKCYPIAPDVAEIAAKYYGYPAQKLEIAPLGVDVDRFTPPVTAEQIEQRSALRVQLGFNYDDLVCLYSGRFSPDKNPQCLAQAIDLLQDRNSRFKGLFIGSGTPEQIAKIQACRGCKIHSFVDWLELPNYYRAADIAVWPKQESTSQLDAAASGLPLILSDQIQVRERVEGNGLLYKENDPRDLARQVLTLTDDEMRQRMSTHGIAKVKANFSWDHIAKQRLEDYEKALRR